MNFWWNTNLYHNDYMLTVVILVDNSQDCFRNNIYYRIYHDCFSNNIDKNLLYQTLFLVAYVFLLKPMKLFSGLFKSRLFSQLFSVDIVGMIYLLM